MIKNSLIIISVLVVMISSLNARVNPFKATPVYEKEKAIIVENLKNPPVVNKDDGNRTIKLIGAGKLNKVTVVESKPIEKIIEKQLVSKKPLEEIILQKPITKEKKVKTYKYNLLSFVDIHITNDIMKIVTKYKCKKYFILKEENKIVFDFIGKKRFYTKRETLSSHKDFKKIIMGAHPKKNYFRVVIQTEDVVSKYKIKISKKGIITVSKKK